MMKLLFFCSAIVSGLILSACATDDSIPSQTMQDATPKMATHERKKKGICADVKTPPTNQCANTVTSTFDSKGVLWIVWTNDKAIYVQSSNDHGNTFSAPVLVNAAPENVAAENESRPKIKVDADGNINLTWVIMLDKKRSSFVRFSRSTDGGKTFSLPVTLNDNLQIIRHRFDSLAVGKNGEIFVAWLDARDFEATKKAGQEAKGLNLYYTVSKDAGKHFSANKSITAHACECCRLDTAIAPDNTPVIIWRHIFDGDIRDHALVKFKDWQTPDTLQRLSDEQWKIDACPHHGPALAISESGLYHAVWFSGAPDKQGLFYGRSGDAGKQFANVINFAKQGAAHPHVVTLGKQVFITWQHFDGKINRAYVMKSLNEGNTWQAAHAIAETADTADEPFLISNGTQVFLSWHREQQRFQAIAL